MSWHQVSLGSASVTRPSPLSVVACDPYKELLWAGSADGALTCLYPSSMEMRVRVQAHARGAPILTLAPYARGVITASRMGVRFHSRGGALLGRFETQSFCHSLTAAATTASGSEAASAASVLPAEDILLAGWSSDASGTGTDRPNVCMVDLLTNQLLMSRETLEGGPSSCLASGRVVACGGGDAGSPITLLDSRDFQPLRTLPGHAGGCRRLLLKGDRLVSIGFSLAPGAPDPMMGGHPGHGRADQLVKIFDLRTFRALPPLLFSLGGGPADAAFLPNFSSTLLVAGVGGVWQTLDAEAGGLGVGGGGGGSGGGGVGGDAFQVEHLAVDVHTGSRACISSMAMASSGDWVFFGDTLGGLHGFTDKPQPPHAQAAEEPRINNFSAPVEYVQHGAQQAPVHMDENTSV